MTITISAVILAGGQARRMNGQDKGLQQFKNKCLIEHIYTRLSSQIAAIAINANRNIMDYKKFGLPVFSDELSGFQGPLSGMLTALKTATTDFVLFTPCDTPFIPLNLCQKLQSAIEKHNALIAYVYDGEREHPICCLVSTKLTDKLDLYLQEGNRKVLQFLKENNGIAVDFSEQKKAFINMNTLADLQSTS
ncbi:molybdenum cofactor guanylyltransferase [Bisgaardia hudsonensis]|uniref:Molybdenum cofactor guanylyltransferase n=1 Tax=Bisgaardia hudsonensis TaxID=109472 RepID=A0A4R2MWG3_9PAST|nr:molybdenum cofactor guanylyltransferase MobA [Bisgaardia hudsonensis]QLB13780.1 molybdenum cofactor guanylyltransferase MobA [Bisgaardia hudsonensis]TCP11737.1 molybdenum cofactor guanylyltransferase [Bisgaardia hudsonensis]